MILFFPYLGAQGYLLTVIYFFGQINGRKKEKWKKEKTEKNSYKKKKKKRNRLRHVASSYLANY